MNNINIGDHFNLLLKTYKLEHLYINFICLSVLTTLLREGFYWSLIYFSEIVKNNPNDVKKFSIILISMIAINIPVERKFNYMKTKLMKEIKIANTKYFNDRIIKMSKKQLLNFDLVEYFNILDHFNENLQDYIINIKNKYDIPVRIVTLLIIAYNKNFGSLIGLFAIFYGVIKSLNEHKLIKETDLTKKYFQYENIIRNYIINSKNFLINDEFNKDYLTNNFNQYEKLNKQIAELNNKLDMNVNIAMFAFIMIVIWLKINELNHYDFFYYFLIIYDIEFISDKVQEYYKGKVSYNKMHERLNYLTSFKPVDKKTNPNIKVNNIIINKIVNNTPKLKTTEPIIIEPNDHILIDGESGSGKTSLLYILKGILKPDILDIKPNIDLINTQTYLTLPNHKSLYSDYLYNIITNYDKKPNIELINFALQSAKLNNKFNNNQFVNIEKLSGGERIRLLISRIIYVVKTRQYNILLFDEIDENLNDELAQEIYINLKNVFNDKIIIYITHNDKVKELFKKKFIVKKGIISKINQ